MIIEWPWDGHGLELTSEQCRIGRAAAAKLDATHYTIFVALKEAGVPVRKDGQYPASQIATALEEYRLRELVG